MPICSSVIWTCGIVLIVGVGLCVHGAPGFSRQIMAAVAAAGRHGQGGAKKSQALQRCFNSPETCEKHGELSICGPSSSWSCVRRVLDPLSTILTGLTMATCF
jgi:hypothetical protein